MVSQAPSLPDEPLRIQLMQLQLEATQRIGELLDKCHELREAGHPVQAWGVLELAQEIAVNYSRLEEACKPREV